MARGAVDDGAVHIKITNINGGITMKKSLAFVTVCVLVLAAQIAASPAQTSIQTAQSNNQTYVWNGELVAFDQGAKTVTVKSMVVGDAVNELGKFKTGDRVLLSWSGFDKYASAINHAVRYDATKKSDERFTFPAEFVAFDAGAKYLTFKAPIPAESISKLQSLKPGQWITATTAHGKASDTQPIIAIREYNDTSNS
jgi:hypothetical protein